jgi:hypothetical protein
VTEFVLVAGAAFLGLVLLVARLARGRSARRRKVAGTLYFDQDPAHSGPEGTDSWPTDRDTVTRTGTARPHRRNVEEPLAPSFSVSEPGHRTTHRGTGDRTVGAPAPTTPAAPWAAALWTDASEAHPPSAGPGAPGRPRVVQPATTPTGAGHATSVGSPAMAEPPVAEHFVEALTPPGLAPLPTLRPKGKLPSNVPAMPPPPPSAAAG